MPEHGLVAGKGKIPDEWIATLEVGSTSIEDVVYQFGEPDLSLRQGRVFVYFWQVFAAEFVTYGSGVRLIKTYLLLVEFDDNNRLERFKHTDQYLSTLRQIFGWHPPWRKLWIDDRCVEAIARMAEQWSADEMKNPQN